jgi:SulP family sulfate permease
VPLIDWIRRSDRVSLRADAVAGLTVAAMLIPQAMAYAALAGMPAVTGLYAATVPLAVYAVLGTSGQLAFGPVAIVSLLTASTVGPLAGGDPATYAGLAALLALEVGALQVLLGLLRAGVLVDLLSHPVTGGFTAGAALVIAASQLDELLGVSVGDADTFVATITTVARQIPEAHGPTVVLGVVAVALLGVARWRRSGLPVALLVVLGAGLAVVALDLDAAGVAVLGTVPAGLPAPSLPSIDPAAATALLPGAATIALLAYLEGISVARALAVRTHQPVDATRELFASGGANLAAGLFQAFPVAGGFSRTAVNFDAGARTPLAGLVTAVIVALAVAVAAPALEVLPTVALAAVVVVAVVGLIDVADARRTWRVDRWDGVTWLLTTLVTVAVGVEQGIAAGVVVSIALFLVRTGRPHIAELGRVRGAGIYRNRERYDTVGDPRVAIVRVDGPLFYANSRHVEAWIEGLLAGRPDTDALIVDMSAVGAIDATGVHAVAALDRALASASVQLRLATVRGPVHDALQRAGVAATLVGRIDPDVPTALHALDVSGPLADRTPDEPTYARPLR